MSQVAVAAKKELNKKVPNINVAIHNDEKRPEATGKFTFINTFNAGYEGHSRMPGVPKMHPMIGGRGEWIFLLMILGVVPLYKTRRVKAENTLTGIVSSTNRYSKMELNQSSREPSKWTL